MYEKYDSTNRYIFQVLTNEYIEATARLLNSEWPRSLGQRCESLRPLAAKENSTQLRIPVSLILLDRENTNRVVGHASLVSISVLDNIESNSTNLTFLISLIIDEEYRGKGLGKIMMNLVEDYLIAYRTQPSMFVDQELDCEYLYLNTKDKQEFYAHLGYISIGPINFFTNREESKCSEIMKRLFKQPMTTTKPTARVNHQESLEISTNVPPPPPLPSSLQTTSQTEIIYWFKKRI